MTAPAELCALTFRQVPEWSGPLTVSYLARTNCRSWVKRQFAAPTICGILGVELPSPDMTVPVTACVKTKIRVAEIVSQLEDVAFKARGPVAVRSRHCWPYDACRGIDSN